MRLFIYGLSAADKIDKIFSNNIHCAMYLFHHKIIASTEKLKNENKKHIEGKGESYEKNIMYYADHSDAIKPYRMSGISGHKNSRSGK